MFEPNKFIHFVFADERDQYIRESLLKLEFDQYLWIKLKNAGYNNVFFMSASARQDSFDIRSFSDSSYEIFKPRCPWLIDSNNQFQKWMLGQLKNQAAIVCPLSDFCRVLDKGEWYPLAKALLSMTKRTGIIVLTAPPYVEDTRDFLLKSKIFGTAVNGQYLCPAVAAVRENQGCNPYTELKAHMGDSFSFFNVFTKERLRALLINLLFKRGELSRLTSEVTPDRLTEYLYYYFHCLKMRQTEPLFGREDIQEDSSFRTLYKKMDAREVMEKLFLRTRELLETGDVSEGLERRYGRITESGVHILRRDELLCQCSRLQLPPGMKKDETRDRAFKRLSDIRKMLASPKNTAENEKVRKSLRGFLDLTKAVLDEQDYDTFGRLLYAIKLCLQWMYVEEGTDKEKEICQILDNLEKNYIALSRETFSTDRSLRVFARRYDKNDMSVAGRIDRKNFEQYSAAKKILEEQLAVCESVVISSVENLRASVSTDLVREAGDQLKRMMKELEDKRQAMPVQTLPDEEEDRAAPEEKPPEQKKAEKEEAAGEDGKQPHIKEKTPGKYLPEGEEYKKLVEELSKL